MRDLFLDAHAGQKRDALVALNHLANRFDGRHFEVPVQGNLEPLEFPHHDLFVGRDDDMPDEGFHAEIRDRYRAPARQAVLRRDHAGQVVGVDDAGDQAGIVGIVTDDPQLQIALDDLGGDLARLAAPNLDLHARIAPPVAADERKQIERGRFVGADEQATRGIVAQLGQGHVELGGEILEAPGVIQHHLPRIGQTRLAATAIDEDLADLLLQAFHRQGDGRLGARQLDRRTREALLGGDRAKNREGEKVHGSRALNYKSGL